MKKYEDFSEDNAFYKEKKEITPLLFSDNSLVESEKRYSDGCAKKERRFLPLAVMMTAVVIAVACMLIFLVLGREESVPLTTEPVEVIEEWRGAFVSREVYEGSLGASVELRGGEYGTESGWSGIIVSENGWIATVDARVNDLPKGRIYALLSDGREYLVEKIFSRGDVALLKISVEKAETVALTDTELQIGERVIAVNAAGELLSGEISNAETLKVNIYLNDEWDGAPIYDARGDLVGMVSVDRNGAVYCLASARIRETLIENTKINE